MIPRILYTNLTIMVLQSSFHLPVFQLWYHSLHSTYHFVTYGAKIFILLTTSSVMMPQSSFHLPVFQLWYHILHSTYHFVSYVPQYSFHFTLCQLWCHNLLSLYQSFLYDAALFISCAKKDVSSGL